MAHAQVSVTKTPARGRGRPRKHDSSLSLEQLLESSAEIFARDGYDGVSLRRLQEELGVSYTFFHHYFDSKEALWRAVVDRLAGATTAKLLRALQHIDECRSELDALREAIRIYIHSAIESPAMFHICQQESVLPGPRLDYLFEHHFGAVWSLLRQMVTRVEQAGLIKPIPLETVYFAVQSATAPVMQGPLYAKLSGRGTLPAAAVERHIEQCIDLLFHGWMR